ncbi:Caleosin-related [Arabidopsis suecica]|uniref:Caleosin-related n=1 Tax=Arabidopsis suecica TaxID=45249 RepID=A0A8T2H7I0_ARASU|nr:Caleosin-related [Arabidopsis suecica]
MRNLPRDLEHSGQGVSCRLLLLSSSTWDSARKLVRFVESKFEEIFNKHARTHKDALTAKEIKQMLKTNREPYDFIGWLSDFIEWKILHTLA